MLRQVNCQYFKIFIKILKAAIVKTMAAFKIFMKILKY
jgi:hypothetical protein